MPASIKLGNITITVPGTDTKQLFKDVSFWANDFPHVCGHCKGTNVLPKHRLTQGFDFYQAVCADCHHEFSFGQAKEGGHLFPKNGEGWKPPYKHQGGEQQGTTSSKPSDLAAADDAW